MLIFQAPVKFDAALYFNRHALLVLSYLRCPEQSLQVLRRKPHSFISPIYASLSIGSTPFDKRKRRHGSGTALYFDSFRQVLRKMQHQVSKADVEAVVLCKPGAVEQVETCRLENALEFGLDIAQPQKILLNGQHPGRGFFGQPLFNAMQNSLLRFCPAYDAILSNIAREAIST